MDQSATPIYLHHVEAICAGYSRPLGLERGHESQVRSDIRLASCRPPRRRRLGRRLEHGLRLALQNGLRGGPPVEDDQDEIVAFVAGVRQYWCFFTVLGNDLV